MISRLAALLFEQSSARDAAIADGMVRLRQTLTDVHNFRTWSKEVRAGGRIACAISVC
jgi:hypothetical protein